MLTDPVLGLLKFSSQDYIDDFVQGRLYMNTLAHFATIEKNLARHDEREGQAFWMQPDRVSLSIKINGTFKTIPGIVGPMAHTHEHYLAANVFCMYALRASVATRLVDHRNFGFGDTFAILRDGDEFLKRVQAAVQKLGQQVDWNLVKYVDSSGYHGPVGIFRKSSEFLYQSEFRIAMFPGMGSAHKLDVGDLSDITVTGPLAELNQRLKVQ